MITQLKKVTTAQCRLIALAQYPMAITLVTLQATSRQLCTASMAIKTGRIAIVLQRIRRPATGLGMQAKRRVLKVIITTYCAPAARY